ncbi:hypothetical protein [Carboxydothermus pertinax]|uniref:Uncharacterized protein n=1 Tax=Carboxydothermus pertinax TaxID=870242 RepID=A0A1L8CSQ6_9THEO|nr:hypothetical protein [Carboxydothermus pertinax]GAV21956.1 hypothetical protein cpu_04660 [Carboxydothermus pertinax]
MGDIKCSNCELCGREVPADLMCTLVLNDENKVEKACWCICPECREKFEKNIAEVYKALISK